LIDSTDAISHTIDGCGAGPERAATAAHRGGARRRRAPAQNARAEPLAQVVLQTTTRDDDGVGQLGGLAAYPEVFVHEAVEERIEEAVGAREVVTGEVGGAVDRALRTRCRRLAHRRHQVVEQHERLQRQPAHHKANHNRHRDLECLQIKHSLNLKPSQP
jgi:hypothetical protein